MLLRKVNVLLPGLTAQPLHLRVGDWGRCWGGRLAVSSPSSSHHSSGSIFLGCSWRWGTPTPRPQRSSFRVLPCLFCISGHWFPQGTRPGEPANGSSFSQRPRKAPLNPPPTHFHPTTHPKPRVTHRRAAPRGTRHVPTPRPPPPQGPLTTRAARPPAG